MKNKAKERDCPVKTSTKTSRRFFLQASAVAAGSLLAACTDGSSSQTEQPVAYAHDSSEWHQSYDVIIIGSGFAGLTAALQARQKGVDVLVVEKMPVFGGNSTVNGGAVAVAGSPLQEKEGINDSVELMVQDMLKAGRGLNQVDLLEVVAKGTKAAYEFTLQHGVQYKPFLQFFGGHSVKRTLQTVESSGAGIVLPFYKSAVENGVIFRNRCKLEQILVDEDGVVGIVVRDGYRFPDEASGTIRRFKVNKGLIVCSGGFSQDKILRQLQDPTLTPDLDSTNQPGATGEALGSLLAVGAIPVQLDQIQMGPWSSPDEKGFGFISQFNTIAGFPNGIMVDIRTGKRFCNELADRKERTDAILKQRTPEGTPVPPIVICAASQATLAQSLPNALKEGVAWEFATIKDIANHFHVPYEPLVEQITLYDSFIPKGVDEQFGKYIDGAPLLGTGPFIVARAWPKVHYTMGGAAINVQAQVLHMMTGKPIPRLYAAGEVTGGVHGASRLGSCSVAECLVMGRIAGENAAAERALSEEGRQA